MARIHEAELQLVQVKVRREVAKALKVYAALNDTSIQQIGVDLYENFVREQGMVPDPKQTTHERKREARAS